MSWKPPRRTLQNVPKLKLAFNHPLPEEVDDVTPINERFIISGQKPFERHRNSPRLENLSSLPDSPCPVEKSYFCKFEEIPEFDHGDDGDLDRILFSDLGDSGGSTWDDSSASFLSWADEIEDAEAAKTKALFEEVERVIYGEESSVKNEELMNECVAWSESHISLRVLGKRSEVFSEISVDLLHESSLESEEEVIAANGYSERPLVLDDSFAECGDGVSTSSRVVSGGLFEKVKRTALEQLALYALSEALKSFKEEEKAHQLSHPQNESSSEKETSSDLSDVSANLHCALQVSGRSLRRSPSVISSELGRNIHFSSGKETSNLHSHPKRFSSIVNTIPEDQITNVSNSSFSILNLPRALDTDLSNSSAKGVDCTNFLSSAGRRKAGLWNRRFSCFTEHDRLVKPIEDKNDYVRNSSGSLRGNANFKQMSVPNTPLKFLKHLSLPPIQNLTSYNKLPSSLHPTSKQSLTHIRRIFVKNKVSLSPLPLAVNTAECGVSDLQLAKSLLDSTPDASQWSSRRKVGNPGSQILRSRKKNSDQNTDEI